MTPARYKLTHARLQELISYDPDTGELRWRVTRGPRRPGDLAGSFDSYGYLIVRVDRVTHSAHRLAWLYMHGQWPIDQIDHINGVRHDNRLCNLREATPAQNAQNRKRQSNNTSGLVGAVWHHGKGRWVSRIGTKHIGYFDTAEAANAAYLERKALAHPFCPKVRPT